MNLKAAWFREEIVAGGAFARSIVLSASLGQKRFLFEPHRLL